MILNSLCTKDLVELLAKDKPFSFTRYGDGEWRTIIGGRYIGTGNSNGCTFTRELSSMLRQVLRNNRDYYHGTLRIALRQHEGEIDRFISRNNIDVPWYKGDFLLKDALRGRLFPFVEQLRRKRIIIVGQPFMQKLQGVFFDYRGLLAVPPINASQHRIEIVRTVADVIESDKPDIVLWSSGLHTKVFVDDLFPKYGNDVTMIDCGSMWDGFCRIPSRSYIRRGRVLWNDLIEVNSGVRERRPGETFRRR